MKYKYRISWKLSIVALVIFIAILSVMVNQNSKMIRLLQDSIFSQQEVISGLVETDEMIVNYLKAREND